MAEIEPSSRLYEQQRRALHDGQRARTASRTATRRPRRSASSSPATGWSRSAMRRPSRCAPSPTMRGASRSWCAMRRPCWSACSTRSSTGWPTSSRTSAPRSSASPRTSSSSDIEERRIPAARLTALLTRIGRAQTLLTKIRYSAVSTNRMLSFLGRLEPPARRRPSRTLRHHLASLTTDVTSLERACELPVATISPSCSTPRSA